MLGHGQRVVAARWGRRARRRRPHPRRAPQARSQPLPRPRQSGPGRGSEWTDRRCGGRQNRGPGPGCEPSRAKGAARERSGYPDQGNFRDGSRVVRPLRGRSALSPYPLAGCPCCPHRVRPRGWGDRHGLRPCHCGFVTAARASRRCRHGEHAQRCEGGGHVEAAACCTGIGRGAGVDDGRCERSGRQGPSRCRGWLRSNRSWLSRIWA